MTGKSSAERTISAKRRPTAGAALSGSAFLDWALVLWRNRGFTAALVRRDIAVRYRGSVLGTAWLVGIPLAMMATYLVVFAGVFSVRFGQAGDLGKTAFAIWIGVAGWQILSESAIRATTILHDNVPYVKRVPFPLALLPIMPLLTACIGGGVSLALFFAGYVVFFGSVQASWLAAPIALLPLLLIAAGTAWFVAALGAFLRDLRHAVPIATNLMMFLTPVLYPMSAVPARVAPFVAFNPLTPVFETIREVLVFGTVPSWRTFAGEIACGLVFAVCGYAAFRSREWEYADVV